MKFLLDMPVSPSLLNVLKAKGHEGVHAHQIGKDQASDTELLVLARREECNGNGHEYMHFIFIAS
jgi:predicted nuclease of predicted toxin-antitoxin system